MYSILQCTCALSVIGNKQIYCWIQMEGETWNVQFIMSDSIKTMKINFANKFSFLLKSFYNQNLLLCTYTLIQVSSECFLGEKVNDFYESLYSLLTWERGLPQSDSDPTKWKVMNKSLCLVASHAKISLVHHRTRLCLRGLSSKTSDPSRRLWLSERRKQVYLFISYKFSENHKYVFNGWLFHILYHQFNQQFKV